MTVTTTTTTTTIVATESTTTSRENSPHSTPSKKRGYDSLTASAMSGGGVNDMPVQHTNFVEYHAEVESEIKVGTRLFSRYLKCHR